MLIKKYFQKKKKRLFERPLSRRAQVTSTQQHREIYFFYYLKCITQLCFTTFFPMSYSSNETSSPSRSNMQGETIDSRSTRCKCNYQFCHYKFWQCTNPQVLTTSASPAAPKVKRPSASRTLTSLGFLIHQSC